MIDVANLDEALVVAAHIPGTTRGTTEIRLIVELPGLPDVMRLGEYPPQPG